MVQNALEYFCRSTGERVATAWNDVGGLEIDYSPYGGYIIHRISNSSGGVSMVFGHGRRSASEMFDFLHGASYYFQSLAQLELIKSWEVK